MNTDKTRNEQAAKVLEFETLEAEKFAKVKGYNVTHVTRLDGYDGKGVSLKPDGGPSDKRKVLIFMTAAEALKYLRDGGAL